MRDVVEIRRDEALYPGELELCLGENAPASWWSLGNADCLQPGGVALFCSRRCPGAFASQAFDVAQRVRDSGRTVLSGFHGPMEQEWLKLFLRSPHPLVMGMGRRLTGTSTPKELHGPLEAGRLLMVSPFGDSVRRVTATTAKVRNRVIAALAERIFVAHVAPGSSTERLCNQVLDWGKQLYCLPDEAHQPLFDRGARPADELLA